MARLLKLIGFFILALALWQAGSASIHAMDVEEDMGVQSVITPQRVDFSIAAPQLPYLPDAELAGATAQTQLLNTMRIQRSFTSESLFLLRDWADRLAQKEAILALHREKLYDATAYYRCQPVCEYYIFALRRILI